jgi:very-short-patch-repair endonuclease
MLELILTRIRDRDLVKAAQGLKFLVLDELHTYRGRQGADVGLLVRRVRHATNSPNAQIIGTSATLASGGSWQDQRAAVARVARLLFGAAVGPDNIVGETLERATDKLDFTDPAVKALLAADVSTGIPPADYEGFIGSTLSAWIELALGVDDLDGRLTRVTPRSITGPTGVAKDLATLTGEDESKCAASIQAWLLQGNQIGRPDGRFSVFAFRLHQFISKGDTVYVSIDRPRNRFITLNAQTRMPEDFGTMLFPLVFCRACGQDYYSVVRKTHSHGTVVYEPTALADQTADEDTIVESGYLLVSDEQPWPANESESLERLPDEWKEFDGRVKSYQRKSVPRLVRVNKGGAEADVGIPAAFVRGPFKFCLSCGISYGGRASSEFSKLGTLGSEGRSTATTLLTMSAIRYLRTTDLSKQAQKVLSFTDNRQDASLQAGHFNDFVQVVQQRGALLRALKAAGSSGIRHDELAQQVFDALGLEFSEYARTKDLILNARNDTDAAFRDVLDYHLYVDLQRGWRLTAPNLEQCGLLEIEYRSLRELCETEEFWASDGLHPALVGAQPSERFEVTRALLDWMRRELAVSASSINRQRQEQLQRKSTQLLDGKWALDEDERLTFARITFPRSRGVSDERLYSFLSGRSAFGNFLRRTGTFETHALKISVDESEDIIKSLLKLLNRAGIVVEAIPPREAGDVAGYQVSAASMVWKAGIGNKPLHDPIRVPNPPEEGGEANEFFVSLYTTIAEIDPGSPEWASKRLKGMEAGEHTAQVDTQDRVQREDRFRAGDLPLLFCSPTMELGVDIALLNVVNLRNVPPTPANYAQRSGRAGRSGQPALVFTYCSKASQHDQYFFRRPHLMVSGQVTPPRLDLANEDLVRSHVYALWLTESGLSLGRSLVDVLDLSLSEPKLLASVEAHVDDGAARSRARKAAELVLADLREPLSKSLWWSPDWLDRQLHGLRHEFERAAERWIGLYTSAKQTADRNSIVAQDPNRPPFERDRARVIRGEAERQLNLLYADESVIESDFYSYRYYASEGFLPGYSFPRLPLSAFIPGAGRDGQGRFVSRPRFLAITEFGPRTFVYHEGSRFQITRVILPASERKDPASPGVLTSEIKRCTECGYLHPVSDDFNPDRCERCNSLLTDVRKQMFRLHNVSTRRRQRINSDEEERQRQGFELESAIRFSQREGNLSCTKAAAVVDGDPVLRLEYGETADIWRINLGERRRRSPNQLGFMIDVETGDWARNQLEKVTDPDSPEDTGKKVERVIPYVQDSRNCLIVDPVVEPTVEFMATLASAWKNAVQAEFELEDQELEAQPLPNEARRRSILLVEAAEGGAGVLRRLVEEPDAVARVAARALDLLHFDEQGNDVQWPPGADAEEQCAVACYDCLLGYRNQSDHLLMNRHVVRDFLLSLTRSHTTVETGRALRTQSTLEDEFLAYLVARRLRRPTDSQRLIEAAGTRPDFIYDESFAVIYIDGPMHDFPDRHARDNTATSALRDLGYTVIRFGHRDEWDGIVARYPDVFGKAQ